MAFHEVQFPVNIGRGARGGPKRKTQVVTLASGDEERNASWANSRRRYDVSYGLRRADDLAQVVAFFEARNGMLYGFRFKDWSDYKSCLPSELPSSADQHIGNGAAGRTQWQLRKRYTSSLWGVYRDITKPVAGTVLVEVNGTPMASGWSVDETTGILTFATAPADGATIRAGSNGCNRSASPR